MNILILRCPIGLLQLSNAPFSIENLTLITIYVLIYSFIGNIALIPHDIIQKGYILFDLQYISDKKEPKKNGYIFAYLFSMVI